MTLVYIILPPSFSISFVSLYFFHCFLFAHPSLFLPSFIFLSRCSLVNIVHIFSIHVTIFLSLHGHTTRFHSHFYFSVACLFPPLSSTNILSQHSLFVLPSDLTTPYFSLVSLHVSAVLFFFHATNLQSYMI